MNKKITLGLLVLALAAFYLSMSNQGAKENGAKSASVPPISTVIPLDSVSKLNQEVGTLSISFKFEPVENCGPSDLDPILEDLARSGDPSLLVSLESPSTDKQPELHSTSISVEQLTKGFEAKLNVAQKDAPSYVGLFLCKDTTGTGQCSSKDIAGYQTLTQNFLHLSQDETKLQEYAMKDKVYFFYPLLVAADGITLFDSIKMALSGAGDSFKQDLVSKLGASEEVNRISESAIKMNQLTTLGNIKVENGTIKIGIPVSSSDPKCAAPTPPAPSIELERSPE